jgi:hypothetical protein
VNVLMVDFFQGRSRNQTPAAVQHPLAELHRSDMWSRDTPVSFAQGSVIEVQQCFAKAPREER